MRLDYNGTFYTLTVPREGGEVRALMQEHGFDLSTTAGAPETAVLFTREPYAAVPFAEAYGTARAKASLATLSAQIEASRRPVGTGHYPVPFDKELWGFQVADLDYIRSRGKDAKVLVGDEPGLGKTQIAIAWANEIQAQRVLVIVPAAIRGQWVTRIREWSTMKYPYIVHNVRSSRDGVHPRADWLIVSYELARSEIIGKQLAANKYDLVILDEGHYLKTIDSQRTRAVFGGGLERTFEPLASRAQSVLALTGTPLPNRPREAYTLARGLCWDSIDFMSEDHFKERFNPSQKITKTMPNGELRTFIDERSGRHAELQARLRSNFMTRHLKREVLTQLKLPVYDLIQVEETQAVKQALAAEKLLDIDPENLEGADIQVFGEVATVRRMMGLALAPQVADYVDMLIDGGEEKLVVFAWHIEVLDILEKAWQRHGVVRYAPGAGTANDRKKKKFITDPNCKIIIGNHLTLGTGTDGLQDVCCHALIAEPDWTPGNNQQCIDRLDRGGQKGTVQADIFVAPNSFAEKILAKALRKGAITDKALDRRL